MKDRIEGKVGKAAVSRLEILSLVLHQQAVQAHCIIVQDYAARRRQTFATRIARESDMDRHAMGKQWWSTWPSIPC